MEEESRIRQTALRRRRRLLKGGLIGAVAIPTVGAFAALDALWIEPYWVEVVRDELPVHDLGDAFVGRTIAHITDLHCSRTVSAEYLDDCVSRVNALRPDIVMLTGDYITYQGKNGYHRKVLDIVGRLRAPLGVYAVLGNHDTGTITRFHKAGSADLQQFLVDGLKSVGVKVMENRSEPISVGGERLWIVGLGDLWSGDFNPSLAFRDVPAKTPTLTLVHNPDAFDRLGGWPVSAVLSGHTHGGQVAIPLVGRPFLPIKNRQYYAGRFLVDGKTLYVSRGLGRIGRVRFNCRPEITLLRLFRASGHLDLKSHRDHERDHIIVP